MQFQRTSLHDYHDKEADTTLSRKCRIQTNRTNGFTLIEVMLSVALLALIAGFSVIVYQSFQVRNDVDIAAITITQSLRRAQFLSQAVDGDEQWGVHVDSGGITLFRGSTYASRDTDYDEEFVLQSTMTPSGLSEVVFEKLTGLPETTGNFMLTATTSDTATITINTKGMVSYTTN